jgi:transcriptional regulator with PAS, ATPase and Fis domain
MPFLTVREPGKTSRVVPLAGGLTTLGHGPDNSVPLDDAGLLGVVVAIENTGGLYSASAVEGAGFTLHGKRQAHARLSDGDTLKLGRTEVTFHVRAPAPPPEGGVAGPRDAGVLDALSELYRFSETLLGQADVDRVLEALVDGVMRLTRADKAFLVLTDGDALHVKVARHVDPAQVDAVERLSDSIVRKVLATRKPLIVSDAANDTEFNAAESVVNLRLCSVMCVPLTDRTGAPFGLLYVGNDRVASLFERRALELLTIYAGQASLIVQNARLLHGLSRENEALRKAAEEARFGDIVGACDAMREVYRRLEKVAATDISVLVTGETGTGKELIARELHRRSPRRGGPFVAINCGAIPETLLESELFGHVKGAFTGAVATRAGRFQAAAGGTLFLDEVGELPPHLQVKLLRALQERAVTKVGETRPEPVDIRVVAATNRVLEDEIKAGRFRDDLYYRLNVVQLHLPPLRARGEDVEVIARHLLARYAQEFKSPVTGLSRDALQAIRRYAWPGNIRQLENRLKKAVVLADGTLVTPQDLDLGPESLEPVRTLQQAAEEFKERYVDEVLLRNGDNRTRTARELGVDARTVFRYLERKRARLEGRPPRDEDPDAGAEA